ncbi:flagellar biosynthetic protein FliR [Ramlibacter sp. USB13]|uniref:Flagellar biosynthetic protein FliR n=1 Tax=Ramlibacter cellulosilyticus TaxID=2764187 RepID=A0A923MSM7_9BURK|nr:flagellar biosynthetic protein FliR [Ramlibacter cellulosilyticus]MBC5785087.1 flagellar biosynthetic protein FliR [Ramlibacter cellulosilyticus]
MQSLLSALGVQWVTTVLLLATRIAALLLLTPLLYAVSIPATARLLLVMALACVLALPFAETQDVGIHAAGALFTAMLREAAIGATLGLGVLLAFAGFSLAGRLVDVQVGFGIAQVVDPLTQSRLPIVSAVFGLLAAVFFFLVDGHHALLRGIAYSVERFPPGSGVPASTAAEPLLRAGAALFTLGFALASPVVLGLLLVDFVLGVIARNLPQMNMFVLGLPAKILVGIFALSAWAAEFATPARRLYEGIHHTWSAWFAAGGVR